MKKKFMLQVVAWLLTLAMLLPSAGATFTTAYAEEEKAAYTGSTTFTGSGNWTEHEMTKSEILGNVDPSKVTYIEFTGTTKFQTGYNDVKRGWTQNPDANKHVCDDIALDDWFAFKFGLANSDGKKCTVTWKVFTSAPKADKEPETPANVVHSGSATFSDSTWWTAYEIKDRAALIGDINPEDIAYVKFTSDTTFLIGYNNGPGYYQTPTEDPVKSWVADDINWDLSAYYLQLMLSKGDGREYTIKWDVVSKVAATPTPTPKPTATPTPTPIPKYTNVGETLTVTENMVKNGVVTIKNAQYDEIIVPAGLGITTINFNVIDVEKLVLEGGENYTVSLRNALVEETTVAASKVREMTIEELTAELDKVKDAKDAHAAISAIIDGFVASQKAQSDAAKAKVKLVARDSELGTIDVNTNVLVDVTDAVLKNLDVSTKDAIARMAVNVVGFDGRASVDLSNVALTLKFNDSALEALNVSGNESVLIEGSASIVETMTLSGVAFVSSNLDTTNLVVDEKNENADVRIYADVNNLIVEGEKNDIILPACASVDNAIVAGDNIRVYGLGVLTHAEVIGTGANVAVQETVVEGENDTSMPKEMMAMMPTAAPTPKPRPEAKKVEVVLDSSYAGDYQRSTKIPASAFEGLTGDVKVTVDFEFLSGYDVWRGFTFYEGDNKIYQPEKKMMTASETITESGRISLDKDKTEVTFTLNADGINHAKSKGISVQYAGVEISKMTFTDANNTVIEKTFAAPYKDWNTYEAILSGAEIGALKAPVTVKVNYTATASDGDKVILPHSDWLPFCAKGYDYYASPEVKTDYSVPYCLKEDGGININVKTINSATFTLTANAVKAIIENGTGIEAQIYGLYLTKATLTEAGTTTNKPANPTAPEEPEDDTTDGGDTSGGNTSGGNTSGGDNTGSATGSALVVKEGTVVIDTNGKKDMIEVSIKDKIVAIADAIGKEKIIGILATGAVDFQVGFNHPEGTDGWKQIPDAKSHLITDFNITAILNGEIKVGMWRATEGTEAYTITWKVYVEGDEIPGGGNQGGNGDNTTTIPTPYPLDDEWPEADNYGNRMSALVTADALSKFTGDVKFTIKYEKSTAGGNGWYNVFAMSNPWTELTKQGSNTSASADSGELVVIISKADIQRAIAAGGLKFQYGEIFFKEAVLEDAEPDEAYIGGEYGLSHTLKKTNINAGENKNVKVTLNYRTVSDAPAGDFWLQVVDLGVDNFAKKLATTDFVNPSFAVESWGGIQMSESAKTITLEVSAAAYAALAGDIGFCVKNIIIEDVKFELTDAAPAGGGQNTPTNVVIFEGEFELQNWNSPAKTFDASVMNGVKCDGTEKVVVTYTASETGQLKFADSSYATISSIMLPAGTGDLTREFILTEDLGIELAKGFLVQGEKFVLKGIKVVEGTVYDITSIPNTTKDIPDWSANLTIEKGTFAECKFDGTETLLISHISLDIDMGYAQMQFLDGSWGTIMSGRNVDHTAVPLIYELPLSSEYQVIAEKGLIIQGLNISVLEVSIGVAE